MIENKQSTTIWYQDGLEKAIQENKAVEWVWNYFQKNKDIICYGGCQTIVTTEGHEHYYTIELNGNDDEDIGFIIQDETLENLHWYWTDNTKETIELAFQEAMYQFLEYVKELEK